jgi:hypothetical protein
VHFRACRFSGIKQHLILIIKSDVPPSFALVPISPRTQAMSADHRFCQQAAIVSITGRPAVPRLSVPWTASLSVVAFIELALAADFRVAGPAYKQVSRN